MLFYILASDTKFIILFMNIQRTQYSTVLHFDVNSSAVIEAMDGLLHCADCR